MTRPIIAHLHFQALDLPNNADLSFADDEDYKDLYHYGPLSYRQKPKKPYPDSEKNPL